MRISDWSSDVCSSDLSGAADAKGLCRCARLRAGALGPDRQDHRGQFGGDFPGTDRSRRGAAEQARQADRLQVDGDRKSVVKGKSVSVRVDLVGRRLIKNTRKKE